MIEGEIVMFAGLNLITEETFDDFKENGYRLFNENKKKVEKEFEIFISNDGSVNGTFLQKHWFPQIKADIFISHSHKDEEKAISLAGWLNSTFGLNAFIDSCVWGFANNLLKSIDEKYCKNPNGVTYDYEKRNYSTSHVHTMLSTALTTMIDNTECVLFLNTPNSLCTSDVINQTHSPWIYLEIAMTQLIRKKEPNRPHEILIKHAFEASEKLIIKYDLNMDHLRNINENDLKSWRDIFIKNQQIKDTLYEKYGFIKKMETLKG
jgi:hypothetical protein